MLEMDGDQDPPARGGRTAIIARSDERSLAIHDDSEQHGGHHDACDDGGPRGSANAHGRRTEVPEDQDPIHHRVEDIGEDKCHHHRPNDAHALKVAPERRIQQQRRNAPRKDVEIRLRQAQNHRIQAPATQGRRQCEDDDRDRNRQQQAEGHPVRQPPMTLVKPAGAERVRDQRVKAEQKAHRKDADRHEQRTADADRADRLWTNSPDHERYRRAPSSSSRALPSPLARPE